MTNKGEMILRFVCHCKNWNEWRKASREHWLYKIHIFFHPKNSPTFYIATDYFIEDGKIVTFTDLFLRGLQEGLKEADNDKTN